jgi:agmatine deiminase
MTVIPAEWSPHRAMWVGWPSHGELWEDNLEPAQAEVEALVRALAGPGREQVRLLVGKAEALDDARARFADVANVEVVDGRFGDIWLRDTGPIFDANGVANAFEFNGWGGKYELEHDDTVAVQIAAHARAALTPHPFILEGGAMDHDGSGTILTTRQCVLNANRNADWENEADAEAALSASLGAGRVIWLNDGLFNDHTDGHVDNLARFVAPGVVACPVAWGRNDPNADVYDHAAAILAGEIDNLGNKLKVVRIPSPGVVVDEDEKVVPASHMNFLIANGAVIVPTYGDETAARLACEALATVITDRQIIPLPSLAILSGGGSFHCITQQEPA